MKLSTSHKPLATSIVVFAIVLIASLSLAPNSPYPWRFIVNLLVVFPAIWVGYEATRSVGRLDELQRRIMLEAITFSLANTALVVFAIGLLQIAGPTYINLIWVLLIFAIFSGVGLWMARRRFQ